MVKPVICFSLVGALIGLVSPIQASAIPIRMDLVPSRATLDPGQEISVDVIVSGLDAPTAIKIFELTVPFDPALVALSGFMLGPYLGDGARDELNGDVTLGPDFLYVAFVSFLTPQELDALQPDNFTLLSLAFTGVAFGTSSFQFSQVRVTDAFGNDIPVGPVPEPATMVLVGLGIAAAALSRSRRPVH